MLEALGVQSVGIIVVAGVAVREATQLIVEYFGLTGRGPKVLISIVLALAAAYLVALAGWDQWSDTLVGGIWTAAWGAHALKSMGNGGVTMEVFDVGDDDGGG